MIALNFLVCSFRPVEEEFRVASQARATKISAITLEAISEKVRYILHRALPKDQTSSAWGENAA